MLRYNLYINLFLNIPEGSNKCSVHNVLNKIKSTVCNVSNPFVNEHSQVYYVISSIGCELMYNITFRYNNILHILIGQTIWAMSGF